MTEQELTAIVTGIAPVLREEIAKALGGIEARVAAIEAKPQVKFCGVFKRGTTYERGDIATHAGSLWVCLTSTSGAPTEDHVGWQLAVKRGSA